MTNTKAEYHKQAINDLLDLIERANRSIARHQAQPDPDPVAVAGFERIRQQHVAELDSLLAEFDLRLLPHASAV